MALPGIGRVPVRAHWTLLLVVVLDLVGALSGRFIGMSGRGPAWPWWLVPAVIPILALVHYAHECGHVLAARWLRGRIERIELHMFVGGVNAFDIPTRAGAFMLYAGSGLLATLLLTGLGMAAYWFLPQTEIVALLLFYFAYANGRLLAINLLPLYPCDMGLFLRGLFWPVAGLNRAVKGTLILGYVSIGLIMLSGFWSDRFSDIFIGVLLLMGLLREHQSIRAGFDPWLRLDPANWPSGPTLFTRWKRKRKQRAVEQREIEEEAEQEVLDRLLAKVSEHGLPALTAAERASLERISRRQRARAESEQEV